MSDESGRGRDRSEWTAKGRPRRHPITWRMGEEAILDLEGAPAGSAPRVVGRFVAVRTAMLAAGGVGPERRRQEREDAAPYVAIIDDERERSALELVLAEAEAGVSMELVRALLRVADLAEERHEHHSASAARRAALNCGVAAGDPDAVNATIRELARLN